MEKKEQVRYSREDLDEFEVLIDQKLEQSRKELEHIKDSLSRIDETSQRGNFEDGVESHEKEHLMQLAARTQKFISDLERAKFRIKNGTYGICVETGNLIPKERLRAVPHTQQCIEVKLKRK
jgi:RNA polymerase-binding transcription factor DksA